MNIAAPARPGTLLFLYGSLMRGFPPHDRFGLHRRAAFLGPGSVRGRLISLGPYPGLIADAAGTVRGEVYRVKDPRLISDLDRFEDFDPARPKASLYLRVTVPLLDDGRRVQVYRYNRPAGGIAAVPDGDWRAFVAIQTG